MPRILFAVVHHPNIFDVVGINPHHLHCHRDNRGASLHPCLIANVRLQIEGWMLLKESIPRLVNLR